MYKKNINENAHKQSRTWPIYPELLFFGKYPIVRTKKRRLDYKITDFRFINDWIVGK